MNPSASLHTTVSADITDIKADGSSAPMKVVSPENIAHRTAIGVRHAGDDGSAAFRIPGLVTTNKGTLLVYTMCATTAVWTCRNMLT